MSDDVYVPHAKQLAFHADPRERRWLCCGYGTGKTTAAVWEAFRLARRHPGYAGIIAAPSFPLLNQGIFAEWRRWMPGAMWSLRQDRWEMRIAVPGGTSIVYWRSTSNASGLEAVNAAWCVFDEATREHSKEPYDVLVARIRRGYPGRQRAIVLTGPPQGAGHWTAKEFGTGPGGERVGDTWQWHDTLHSTIRARTADNPYLPHDYEANLRNRPGATRAWCRQYLDAEFIAGEGQIFSEFRRDTHIVRPEAIPSQFRRVIIGVDWGYSHHGAMIVVGVTGSGTLYVIAEECHKELPVTDSGWLRIARELRDKHRPERFVADPSEPGYITTLRQTLGVTVVENADNDVHEGIRRITRSFEPVLAPGEIAPRPRMFISSRCTRLVEEIEGYRYRESRGIVTEAPQEHDDDAIDALRYAVMACTRHR